MNKEHVIILIAAFVAAYISTKSLKDKLIKHCTVDNYEHWYCIDRP